MKYLLLLSILILTLQKSSSAITNDDSETAIDTIAMMLVECDTVIVRQERTIIVMTKENNKLRETSKKFEKSMNGFKSSYTDEKTAHKVTIEVLKGVDDSLKKAKRRGYILGGFGLLLGFFLAK